jgi:hypothetical protein
MNVESREFEIDTAANGLLGLFEDNTEMETGSNVVTEVGLISMGELFNEIPMEDRGYVFLAFLGLLYEEGYSYDMQQFLTMEQVQDNENPIN